MCFFILILYLFDLNGFNVSLFSSTSSSFIYLFPCFLLDISVLLLIFSFISSTLFLRSLTSPFIIFTLSFWWLTVASKLAVIRLHKEFPPSWMSVRFYGTSSVSHFIFSWFLKHLFPNLQKPNLLNLQMLSWVIFIGVTPSRGNCSALHRVTCFNFLSYYNILN